MRVLIAVASRHGATSEIANEIGKHIREAMVHPPIAVDVRPIRDVGTLDGYDAYVVGSAIYAGHWMNEAVEFTRRHQDVLREAPTWLFSSGPVGTPLKPADADPVDLTSVIQVTGAIEHRLFAGRIDRQQLGIGERFLVRAMRAPEGDFRDWAAVREWAAQIVERLAPAPLTLEPT